MSTHSRFISVEAVSGIGLIAAAVAAVALANSPAHAVYLRLLNLPVGIVAGDVILQKPLLLWINEGLMAVFFLLVGLEIKREICTGALSAWRQASLPVIAAVGGMALPAVVFSLINAGNHGALRGWAIPTATDIAFSLGVLSLFGRRVPPALKVFLLALAIIDDLGGIVIIALFYTAELAPLSLLLAVAALLVLAVLNLAGVRRTGAYVVTGALLWTFVVESGVHATLSGVALAMAVPLRPGNDGQSPLRRMEHALHPWVNYAILPVFAFANAGVSLRGLPLEAVLAPVPVGIALGLFVGKQAGVLAAAWLAVRAGVAALPAGVTWRQFHGVAILTGIGFTMSLFIGTLAFAETGYSAGVRIGVLMGSLASALVGAAWLALATRR